MILSGVRTLESLLAQKKDNTALLTRLTGMEDDLLDLNEEIAEVLEVSESRVSQLHTRALQKMREKLRDYLGIVTGSR